MVSACPRSTRASARAAVPRLLAAVIPLLACVLAAPRPAAAAHDPFAPPGTEYARVEILHRGMADELTAMGLAIEERGQDCVYVRVTAQELATLRARGFPVSVVPDTEYAPPFPEDAPDEATWTSYAQLTAELQSLAATFPSLATLESWGQSVQARQIWGLRITRNPGIEEVEPEVRFVGAHHGNERMGVELCRRLAHLLLESYGTDPEITQLVNSREIWIVPMMNPDGVESGSRYNAHGVDLNRNYGYMWEGGGSSGFSEPETRAIRDLSTANRFTHGLSYHTTAAYVNSLWNYTPQYSQDDAVVWTMTTAYASWSGYTPVRGWYWYETHGDCNDWSYGARSTLDWTIETASTGEATVWDKNRPGMLYVLGAAGWGIHGVVTDAITGAPLAARVTVDGVRWPVFTDPALGDYHRPLMAGSYTLRVKSNGHQDATVTGVVVPASGGITVNVALMPGGGRYGDLIDVANVADPLNGYANQTLTPDMLGAPDGTGCSIGRGGSVIIDFGAGSEARDITGADLRVSESAEDATGERFTLYAGNSYLGPWTSLGMGTGSSSFDLAGSGLGLVRYVRIVDDGDGTASDPNAGFEIDAIESFGVRVTSVEGGPVAGTGGGMDAAPLRLMPPAPNPLRLAGANASPHAGEGGGVTLGFCAPAGGRVRISIIDARGRLVAIPFDATVPAGAHSCTWSGEDTGGRSVAPGLYLVRLDADTGSRTQKLMIMR